MSADVRLQADVWVSPADPGARLKAGTQGARLQARQASERETSLFADFSTASTLAPLLRTPYLHDCTEHGAPEVEGLPGD